MRRVLVLASSPTDQEPLRLSKEHKIVRNSLESAANRDQFEVITDTATTVDDLRVYLLKYSPDIVHFCGHGAGEKGLCFEDEQGGTHPVNGERLAKLFHLVQDDVKCVVLNACYSESQAKAISEHIDFVVGMKGEIGDDAALKFAEGFYQAIWACRAYEQAFKFGCSAIDTANIPEEHVPVILKSPRLGGLKLQYSEDTQRIENFLLRYMNSDPQDRARLTTAGERLVEDITKAVENEPRRAWSSVSVLSSRTVCNVYKEVRALLRTGLEHTEHTFYLKTHREGFLLDWEASGGRWPVPFKTYKALGTAQPLVVRVVAELDDYFNYDFESDEFVSVKLEHISGDSIHGYVKKWSPLFGRIVDILSDGKPHRITVTILPRKGTTSHVHIVALVSDSWVITTPDNPTGSTDGATGGAG